MEFIYTVYQITNLINDKIYVGVHKTKNPNDSYMGSGLAVKDAIKKYGKENFRKDVLFEFQTLEEAYNKENEIVTQEFVSRDDTYNLATGGSVSPDWTEDRKLYYREWMKGEGHPFYGKRHSEESKAKISAGTRGRKMPREGVEQRAAARRGVPSKLRGTTQTPESNAKRSESHKNLAKKECPHCLKQISPQNFSRFHGDKCKVLIQPSHSE